MLPLLSPNHVEQSETYIQFHFWIFFLLRAFSYDLLFLNNLVHAQLH